LIGRESGLSSFAVPPLPLKARKINDPIRALDFVHDAFYHGRKFRLLNKIDERNIQALRIDFGSSVNLPRLLQVIDELMEFH
jgi:hypothetical protein